MAGDSIRDVWISQSHVIGRTRFGAMSTTDDACIADVLWINDCSSFALRTCRSALAAHAATAVDKHVSRRGLWITLCTQIANSAMATMRMSCGQVPASNSSTSAHQAFRRDTRVRPYLWTNCARRSCAQFGDCAHGEKIRSRGRRIDSLVDKSLQRHRRESHAHTPNTQDALVDNPHRRRFRRRSNHPCGQRRTRSHHRVAKFRAGCGSVERPCSPRSADASTSICG